MKDTSKGGGKDKTGELMDMLRGDEGQPVICPFFAKGKCKNCNKCNVGSTNNTFGAVPLVAQQNTPVGQAIDYQQVRLNQINPGNSINLQSQSATGSIANSTVTTTAFP